MDLKDVTVIDFNIRAGLKGPVVKAMAQFTIEGVTSSQIVWIELTAEEALAVLGLARMVEHRFMHGETPVPEEVKRPLGFNKPDS